MNKPLLNETGQPVSHGPDAPARPKNLAAETVLSVRHYTDDLFAFRTTRAPGFRFRSGEFAMIGLPDENGKPILRAYSIASPSWDEELEFFSIKVADGPLTSKLQKIVPGDEIWLRPKPTGTLVHDALLPGKTLWCFSTGTGVAPFASVIRDPDTYERFERVVLTHTTRTLAELAYSADLVAEIAADETLGELVGDRLTYVPSVTREDPPEGIAKGRITHLIETGELFDRAGTTPLDPAEDRVMICGSTAMNADVRALCEKAGLVEGSNAQPGTFVVEKAFVG